VKELKIQKKSLTKDEKTSAILGFKSTNSSGASKEEGKIGAKEPLYLLRYE
jgi:hypothetical protein